MAHRDKYNAGGWWGPVDNRADIENKFENAKKWLAGYTETDWWGGTTTHKSRTDNFLGFLDSQYNLGTAIPVTINKDVAELPEAVTVNDINLSEGVFDGKFFPGCELTISATAPEGKSIAGWKVVTTPTSGSEQTDYYNGNELVITPENCKSMSIEVIFGVGTGISEKKAECNDDVKAIYNLRGERLQSLSSGVNIVVYGNGEARKVVR